VCVCVCKQRVKCCTGTIHNCGDTLQDKFYRVLLSCPQSVALLKFLVIILNITLFC